MIRAPHPPAPEDIDPARRFDGATYSPDHDAERLTGQLRRVWDVVRDGRWTTLLDLACAAAPATEAAVSARLRDLRKEKYGSHIVERRRVKGRTGLWEYRLLIEKQRCAR